MITLFVTMLLCGFFLLTFLILITPIVHFLSSDFFKAYFDISNHKPFQYVEYVYQFFFSSDMWGSTIAYILNLVVAIVGMGVGSLIIFLLVTPALNLVFPFHIPFSTKGIDIAWSHIGAPGDSVWPTMIMIALQFSVGFIIAGYTLILLKSYDLHFALKAIIYIFILWTWGFLLWATTLSHLHTQSKSKPIANLKRL